MVAPSSRGVRPAATATGRRRPGAVLPSAVGRRRPTLVLLLAVLLATTAGCTAFGIEGPGADAEGTTDRPTDASTTAPTTDGTTPAGAAGEASSTATGTAPTTADGHDHAGHDHGDGGSGNAAAGTGGTGTATTTSAGGNATTAPSDSLPATGRLAVVVGAEEVTAGAVVETAGFRYDAADHHAWRAADGTTLAAALSTLGVEADGGSLTHDGTTYRDGEDGVAVDVRVDGEPVSPGSYVLRDGDEVWVTVETPGMAREPPGEYVRATDQHVHGRMQLEVDGTVVDFAEPRYQSGHRQFHFEGGHADPWHAHSFSVTLAYALGTLDGIAVGNGTLTHDGTTYRDDDPGTTVSVTVNGEPVEPSAYYLKDGDDVRVVVETT